MNKTWYAKQYWKLFVSARELKNDLDYVCATDFCSGCSKHDDDNCCRYNGVWDAEYEDDFRMLSKLIRLRDFAYKYGDDAIAMLKPDNLGLARSIHDLRFPEVR